MASPMREKRAWPPRDKEAADESVASFEASVAGVKQTVITSSEVLSSAKEDLHDHQRWLEVQSAAIQADRARHDRWLQRQRERQEALERREQARHRRKLMRQRAVRSVKDAASAAFLFVYSVFWFVVGRTIAGLNYIDALAASGLAWIGARLRDVALYIARNVSIAVAWVARQAAALGLATGKSLSAAFFWCAANAYALAASIGRLLAAGFYWCAAKASALALAIGKLLSAGFSWCTANAYALAASIGRLLAAGFYWCAAKASALALAIGKLLSAGFSWCTANAYALAASIGRLLAAGFSRVAAKVRELTPSIGRFLSICFSGIYARAYDLTRATGRLLATGFSAASPKAHALAGSTGRLLATGFSATSAKAHALAGSTGRLLATGFSATSAKAHALAGSTGRALAPAFSAISAKAYAVAPSLAERIAKAGLAARDYAREGAVRAQGLFQTDKAARAADENEVSSPRHVGGFDLSQMLIIAGTLLLVVGGLMLGGGLILRAGTPSQVASTDGIAWLFQQKDLSIAERSVFAFAGTPQGLRIKGFSISGQNGSDQPLTGVEGIIKPDVPRPDLKLALSVDRPEAGGAPEAQAGEPEANDVIPPHAPFKLVFAFPTEAANGQDGVTPEEVLATFGGLMLKVRYELAGKQRTFIEYLSPEKLKEQLVELQAGANGS